MKVKTHKKPLLSQKDIPSFGVLICQLSVFKIQVFKGHSIWKITRNVDFGNPEVMNPGQGFY